MRAIRRTPGADTAKVDRALSLSQLVTSAAANAATVEPWASQSAWSPSTGCQVSGGRLFGLSGPPNPSGGALNMPITSGSTFRYVTTIDHLSGGSGFVGIGICTSAAPLGAAAANARMWGILNSAAQKYVGGAFSNIAQTNGAGSGASLASGAYRLSITSDATNIQVSLMNSTGTAEYVDTVSWAAAGAQASIVFWNSDSRALTGSALRGLSFRKALNTTSPRGVYEDTGPTLAVTSGGTGAIQVRVPATYDSTVGCAVVMYYHGSGGGATAPFADASGMGAVTSALLSAGYIVVSLDTGNDWGNQAAVDYYRQAYQWVRDHFSIGQVFHLPQSMGGLASLLTIAERKVPAAGWLGIYPVCNLRNLYDNVGSQGSFAAAIRTAYGVAADGSDYSTKTAGHDPVLLDGRAFRGLPMKFYSSPSDTVVPKVSNTDQLATLASPYALVAPSTVTCSGEHGDASHFQPTQVVQFFNSLIDPVPSPSAPTGLSTSTGDSQVTLTWSAPSTPYVSIVDYIVQYRTASGPGSWNTFTDGTSASTTATVTGLTDGVSYDFQVAAVSSTSTQGPFSSTATATPADAINLSSLLVHLDASAIPAQSDNTALTSWTDSKSGAVLSAANAPNASSSPTYRTTGSNSRPYAQFRAASTQSTGTTGNPYTTTTSSFTIFAVINPQSTTQSWPVQMAAGAGRHILQSWSGSSGQLSYFGSGITNLMPYTNGTWIVFEVVNNVSGNAWEARKNGALISGASGTFAGVGTGTGNLFLGIANGTPWYRPDIDIAEFVYYNAALTTTERVNIRTFLGSKYGITIS